MQLHTHTHTQTCDSAQTRPGWFCTSVHCTRACPEPFVPELLLRGISNTLAVSVTSMFRVAANDCPEYSDTKSQYTRMETQKPVLMGMRLATCIILRTIVVAEEQHLQCMGIVDGSSAPTDGPV